MTKDVVISVRGLQVMDNESAEDIETVQQGEYYERNGSIFLLYDEYPSGPPPSRWRRRCAAQSPSRKTR